MFLPQPPRRTLRQRLALEVHEVLERLERDRDHAIATWNVWRSRDALLEAVAHDWHRKDAATLLELEPVELLALERFYRTLERFALWVRCTEAMPATLEHRYDVALEALKPLGQAAIDTLGGLPPDVLAASG